MKARIMLRGGALAAFCLGLVITPASVLQAQEGASSTEEIIVTGSRIRRDPLQERAPVMDLNSTEIEATGLTNLGDALQDLPITGSAINSQFNVPGNSGFPQDGSGIGAGAVEVSLRNVGAKRTLILVDGKRWIAGASASGVPTAVDLNTIPDNVIERIEILQDGASAIYGSDAIGGVINVITNADFEGFRFETQTGGYISEGDGESHEFAALWGGGNDTTHAIFSASYTDERGIETADRSRSAFPNPNATTCDVPGSFCSSFTPQGRFVLGPAFGLYRNGIADDTCTPDDPECGPASITLNDGVLNDGGSNVPVFDPDDLNAGDFHQFTSADRFNYNGPGFNFLRTPNERVNLYTQVTHELTPSTRLSFKASYTNRSSATKAAPEPLCLGNDCGNRINDNFVVDADNPFNPFGVDLSVADGTLDFFGRRPLESGGRLFFQDVNTYFGSATLDGEFSAGNREYYWDLTASFGDNRGFQEKYNSHNAAKLQVAMGDPAVCAATPNCVPFNFFGGQGPDGNGSITQAMLDFVTYTQRDFSEQTLKDFAFNIGGNIAELPAGPLGFAAGVEYREHEGSFRPDPVAERGETAGIPSGSTAGGFDVAEVYGELAIPLIDAAQYLELNLAVRGSDYTTSGSESTYKVSSLYRPLDELSFRGSISTGLRAPGIGELFGGAAREDFTFTDPCTDYTAILGSSAGGRDTAQSAAIQANCASLGVDPGVAQLNPQLSAVSAGNSQLVPESSDAFTIGMVWSPSFVENVDWIERLVGSIDYYDLEIDDAIQGQDPGELINACVETLDPFFCNLTPRSSAGRLGLIQNKLQNIGGIEASGLDLMLAYTGPETRYGSFNVNLNATHLDDFIERTRNPDGSLTENVLTGTHTNETFQRAFPDWRMTTKVGWDYTRWAGTLTFRWVDEMDLGGGATVDSAMYTDLNFRYVPPIGNDALTVNFGLKNALDENPPVCFPCGVIGLSTVAHDLPGRVGYVGITYEPQ